jgi:hypothetical protein
MRASLHRWFRRHWAKKEISLPSFRILLPDGTIKYLEANTNHDFPSLGALLEVICTNVDVTEPKRAKDEREKLRQLESDLARDGDHSGRPAARKAST